MTDLIDAVSALTKPSRTKVVRDDGSTTVVAHDALLVQLEAAVTSAIGNGGGGGSATGSVINDAALARLLQISSQIRKWCRQADVQVTRYAVDNLERWKVAALAFDTYGQVIILEQWAYDIRNLLDPPKTVPLSGACPVCKAVNWEEGEGENRTIRASPVAALYDHANPYRSVRAVCRAGECGTEWLGADAVEELIAEMSEDPETAVFIDRRRIMTYPQGYWCTNDDRCTVTNHSVNCPKWHASQVLPEPNDLGSDHG